jgi:ubiquinone/menaquinone biosynthesis C-methylase UbiE
MTFAAYDEVAEAYHQAVDPDGEGMREPAIEELLQDIRGQRVLSLACGQGRDARRVADLGASVVGVDVSTRLLEYAQEFERTTPRGIEYLEMSAHDLAGLADETFDGVLCTMALMDIPELEPTVASVARVLRPGGWFVFSITHPCYKTPADGDLLNHADGTTRRVVGRYFAEGPYVQPTRWDVLPRRAYHRMLSTYVNTLAGHGLLIVGMNEPRGDRPVWQEVPGVLNLRCVKSHTPPTP